MQCFQTLSRRRREMKITRYDWLLERARWSYTALSGFLAWSRKIKRSVFGCFVPYNKSFIDQACSVKMARYWPRSFFACLWTDTKSSRPISSHLDRTSLVNNPYISWTSGLLFRILPNDSSLSVLTKGIAVPRDENCFHVVNAWYYFFHRKSLYFSG